MRSPAISVLMPVYNCAEFLQDTMDSILCQSMSDFELIIVDDGSKDKTSEIVISRAQQDSRIIYLRQHKNKGVASSLNYGLRHVTTEFVARMDGEDIANKKRFEVQLQYLRENPEIGVVGTQTEFIDLNGEKTQQAKWIKPTKHNMIAWRLLFDTPICHPSTMIRTFLLKASGGYDENYPNEDMQLWTRLAFETRFANLSETMLKYRMPPERHLSRLIYWEPHVKRVAKEYMEKILGRSIQRDLVQIIFNLMKYGDDDEVFYNLTLSQAIRASELLIDVFGAMVEKQVLETKNLEDVSRLLEYQTRSVISMGAKREPVLL